MKRYFAISDIHGRYSDFVEEFEKIGFQKDNPDHIMIFNGDYFDRGEDNKLVFQELLEIKEEYGSRAVLIRGNHDINLEELLRAILECSPVGEIVSAPSFDVDIVFQNGGDTTFAEFFPGMEVNKATKMTKEYEKTARELLDFLLSLEDFHIDTHRKIIFVHAGFDHNRKDDLYISYEDRKLISLPSVKEGYSFIVGHTPIPILAGPPMGIGCFNSDTNQLFAFNRYIDNNVYVIDNGYGDNFVAI